MEEQPSLTACPVTLAFSTVGYAHIPALRELEKLRQIPAWPLINVSTVAAFFIAAWKEEVTESDFQDAVC